MNTQFPLKSMSRSLPHDGSCYLFICTLFSFFLMSCGGSSQVSSVNIQLGPEQAALTSSSTSKLCKIKEAQIGAKNQKDKLEKGPEKVSDLEIDTGTLSDQNDGAILLEDVQTELELETGTKRRVFFEGVAYDQCQESDSTTAYSTYGSTGNFEVPDQETEKNLNVQAYAQGVTFKEDSSVSDLSSELPIDGSPFFRIKIKFASKPSNSIECTDLNLKLNYQKTARAFFPGGGKSFSSSDTNSLFKTHYVSGLIPKRNYELKYTITQSDGSSEKTLTKSFQTQLDDDDSPQTLKLSVDMSDLSCS